MQNLSEMWSQCVYQYTCVLTYIVLPLAVACIHSWVWGELLQHKIPFRNWNFAGICPSIKSISVAQSVWRMSTEGIVSWRLNDALYNTGKRDFTRYEFKMDLGEISWFATIHHYWGLSSAWNWAVMNSPAGNMQYSLDCSTNVLIRPGVN